MKYNHILVGLVVLMGINWSYAQSQFTLWAFGFSCGITVASIIIDVINS